MPTKAALDRPPSRGAYPSWLRRKFKLDAIAKGRSQYDAVALSVKDQVERSAFWKDLNDRMADFEAEYRIATDFDLLVGGKPQVLTKGWDRFLDKTFRKNVFENRNFPDSPEGGWITPPAWYSAVKDIVRTMFVVKYLDGVDYLGKQIETVADHHGHEARSTLEYSELGYYAGHIIVRINLDIALASWETVRLPVGFEIQVTTQVQEVIRRLLHSHYERHQLGEESGARPWQWEYDGHEFAANYLGHILHYLEGQIMKVRQETQ